VNRGGKTNRRRERMDEEGKRGETRRYETKRSVLRWRIGRRMGEGGEEGEEKARKSENEYGLTRV